VVEEREVPESSREFKRVQGRARESSREGKIEFKRERERERAVELWRV
jgi:hypothetical protein